MKVRTQQNFNQKTHETVFGISIMPDASYRLHTGCRAETESIVLSWILTCWMFPVYHVSAQRNRTEMNDGVYFDQNGNEVIVINGFEYSREEFDSLVDMCGDCNM